jgi:hypothetical protein
VIRRQPSILNFFDLYFPIPHPDLSGRFFTPVSGITCHFNLHQLLLTVIRFPTRNPVHVHRRSKFIAMPEMYCWNRGPLRLLITDSGRIIKSEQSRTFFQKSSDKPENRDFGRKMPAGRERGSVRIITAFLSNGKCVIF